MIVENCVRLSCYAVSSGNSLPTFRENLSGTILKGQESTRNVCNELPLLAA